MSGRGLTVLVIVVALAGCGRRHIGHFGEGAFYHVHDHYRIRYDQPEDPRLMSAPWVLENYLHDGDGNPTVARDDERFFAWYQAQGEGRPRGRPVRVPRVDLLFRRGSTPAHVWVRSLPLDDAWAGKSLSSIVADALHALSTGEPAPDLFGRPGPSRRDLAIRVLSRGPAVVDGRAAWSATFDLGTRRPPIETEDVPTMRERVTLVLVDSGSTISIGGRAFPIVLVAGCSSRPDDAEHDARRAELAALVRRVDLALAP